MKGNASRYTGLYCYGPVTIYFYRICSLRINNGDYMKKSTDAVHKVDGKRAAKVLDAMRPHCQPMNAGEEVAIIMKGTTNKWLPFPSKYESWAEAKPALEALKAEGFSKVFARGNTIGISADYVRAA